MAVAEEKKAKLEAQIREIPDEQMDLDVANEKMAEILAEDETQTSELATARLREVMELPEDLVLPNMIRDEAVRQLNEKMSQELEKALFKIMETNFVYSNQKSHQIASDLEQITSRAYQRLMKDPLGVISSEHF